MSDKPTLEAVREQGPLVQCVTNLVSMDIMANVLLALGASPAMVACPEEAEDFARIASALCVNMGTLDPASVVGMKAAIRGATATGKPWVLDPVGMGATPYRSAETAAIASLRPTVIRGNASEIMALTSEVCGGEAVSGKGVDSSHSSLAALAPAETLARHLGCIVAVTGVEDYVLDGQRTLRVNNGHEMMTCVTAVGCSLGAVVAACLAAAAGPSEYLSATAHALAVYGLCGEMAMEPSCAGPGSFRVAFMDRLHSITDADVAARGRIEELSGSK